MPNGLKIWTGGTGEDEVLEEDDTLEEWWDDIGEIMDVVNWKLECLGLLEDWTKLTLLL